MTAITTEPAQKCVVEAGGSPTCKVTQCRTMVSPTVIDLYQCYEAAPTGAVVAATVDYKICVADPTVPCLRHGM